MRAFPLLAFLSVAVVAHAAVHAPQSDKDVDSPCTLYLDQQKSQPTYGSYCRISSISGYSGFFDCTCSGPNVTQPILREVTLIDGSAQPGFMWLDLKLPNNVTAFYNYTTPDGMKKTAVTSTPGNHTGPFEVVDRAPAQMVYNVMYEGSAEGDVEFVAGWLPCRSSNPVQTSGPQKPSKGLNGMSLSWSLPSLASGPLDQLSYDLYLQNETSGPFSRVRTGIEGRATYLNDLALLRKCKPYTARLMGVARYMNGSTGPECPQAYDDVSFYLRAAPTQPGAPVVDETTLEKQALEVVWEPSQDDGGCPVTYILSLLDQSDNNICASAALGKGRKVETHGVTRSAWRSEKRVE
jgi:hypothetical protein